MGKWKTLKWKPKYGSLVSVLPFPYFGFRTSAFSTCPQTSTTTLECTAPLLCHKKPFLKHCYIPYCTEVSLNFCESLNVQILWIFNCSQKCITKIFYTRQIVFMLWQQDCQWQDHVVSIALLTVANSSGQQFSGGCLINLACMPHPTVHGMWMQRFHKIISIKLLSAKKIRLLKSLHCMLCPSYVHDGIFILSINIAQYSTIVRQHSTQK